MSMNTIKKVEVVYGRDRHIFRVSQHLTFGQLLEEATRHWGLDAEEYELTDHDGDTWPRSGVVRDELIDEPSDPHTGLPTIHLTAISKFTKENHTSIIPAAASDVVVWTNHAAAGVHCPNSHTNKHGSPLSKIRPPKDSEAVRQAVLLNAVKPKTLFTSGVSATMTHTDTIPFQHDTASPTNTSQMSEALTSSGQEQQQTASGDHQDGTASPNSALSLSQSGDYTGLQSGSSTLQTSTSGIKRPIRLLRENEEMYVSEVVENSEIHTTPTTPKQVRLIWEHPPQTVLVIKKIGDPKITSIMRELTTWLKQEKNVNVLVEPEVKKEELPELETWEPSEFPTLAKRIDLVICLGGDGTVLHVNSLFQESTPPVVAFNLGSLGFLTPFRIRNYKRTINAVMKECFLTLRSRLYCVSVQYDENKREKVTTHTVLNEVVIDRGNSSYLSHLECFCDDIHVTTIQADGIIVATATGSTAYSLSAGGSMVHPQVPAIVFTPICPHSLSFRPLLFPDAVELKIQVPRASRASAWASFDGRYRTELKQGDYIIIKISKWPFVWINNSDTVTDWFKSLAECLHWNDRMKQK